MCLCIILYNVSSLIFMLKIRKVYICFREGYADTIFSRTKYFALNECTEDLIYIIIILNSHDHYISSSGRIICKCYKSYIFFKSKCSSFLAFIPNSLSLLFLLTSFRLVTVEFSLPRLGQVVYPCQVKLPLFLNQSLTID